ncbi:MAG: MupG family TIM beta-alpha barrel fold protein, partial [Carnobacterium sp.]
MGKLGVSIYPDHSDFSEDVAYLEKAKKHGFERVFMSMLEVSEGKEIVFNKFFKIIKEAKDR